MNFSTGLALKALGVIAAIGTPTALTVVYKDELSTWLKGDETLEEIINKLGIQGCSVSDNSISGCSLDAEKLKTINFSNKKDKSTELNITTNASATLKVEKTEDKEIFPNGFKFTFTASSAKIDIKKDSSTEEGKIVLEVNTPIEFKAVKSDSGEYSLEKAWDANKLSKKTGLNCSFDSSSKKCTLSGSQKINVWKANDDYVTDATIGGSGGTLVYAEDTKDHNQGFKFTVEADVTLSGGAQKKSNGGISKLTKENKSYEIGIKKIDNSDKWFFIEKDTTSSSS